jgi:hypothetical protein
MDTFEAKGQQRYPVGIVQFLQKNFYLTRPILRGASVADVAVGVVK